MRYHKTHKSAAIAVVLLFWGTWSARAGNQQDYCIKCSNPEQTYICRIVSTTAQTQGKQFLCIMNIAKEKGHDSCSASTGSQSCSGVLVQYEVSGGTAPPSIPVHKAAPLPQTDAKAPSKNEPKTLVEFTKQATKATKNSLKSTGENTGKAIKNTGQVIKNTGSSIKNFTSKVGSNIKGATKTTVKCITSLFSNCSSD